MLRSDGKCSESALAARRGKRRAILREQCQLQSMILPGILVLLIFSYFPMYGVIVAFKDYNAVSGFIGSPWATNLAGETDIFYYFRTFLKDARFWEVIRNTLAINIIGLFVRFPMTIIFALLLNELRAKSYKKIVQSISYLPYFLSWIVYGGLMLKLLSGDGALNSIMLALGIVKDPVYFLTDKHIWGVAIISDILKSTGYGSIIYVAAISSVDEQQLEAAALDGAGRFKRIWHVILPAIKPTIVLFLVFNVSGLLGSNFDQMLMLCNDNQLAIGRGEVIDLYVYNRGLGSGGQLEYATAVGLSRSVISVILLIMSNFTAKKLTGSGIY